MVVDAIGTADGDRGQRQGIRSRCANEFAEHLKVHPNQKLLFATSSTRECLIAHPHQTKPMPVCQTNNG
jgi:hypothetical protein